MNGVNSCRGKVMIGEKRQTIVVTSLGCRKFYNFQHITKNFPYEMSQWDL